MAAAVRAGDGDELNLSRPEPLFTIGDRLGFGLDRDFDATSDGERFLFLKSADGASNAATVELVLVQNWVEELARLVPREP